MARNRPPGQGAAWGAVLRGAARLSAIPHAMSRPRPVTGLVRARDIDRSSDAVENNRHSIAWLTSHSAGQHADGRTTR